MLVKRFGVLTQAKECLSVDLCSGFGLFEGDDAGFDAGDDSGRWILCLNYALNTIVSPTSESRGS